MWSTLWRACRAVPVVVRLVLVLGALSLVGLLAFWWPLLIAPGSVLASATTAPLVLGVVLAAALVVTLVAVSEGGLDVRAVAMLGLLSAVGGDRKSTRLNSSRVASSYAVFR